MALKRHGKPYIWVTWLAKLLGGNECQWRAWFQAHYQYQKFEEQAMDLVKWNRDHNRLMAARVKELQADGWSVSTEAQNAFKLEGKLAIVAGKPDIVATKDGQTLVIDGKTGRERDSDIWQVLFYLFAIPKAKPNLDTSNLIGEVQYARGDARVTLTHSDLDEARLNDIVRLIEVVAADEPPAKVPSRDECVKCNIGPKDCPQRVMEHHGAIAVGEF
jgi:CRISPR/Cas system-associated exonuclease Cas4 (RecB family)